MKQIGIIIPYRDPDHISICVEDNVTLQTILERYEDYGNAILLNGLEKPLTTIVEEFDVIFILNKSVKQ